MRVKHPILAALLLGAALCLAAVLSCLPLGTARADAPTGNASAADGVRLERLLATAPPDASGTRRVQVRAVRTNGQPAAGVTVRFSMLAVPKAADGVTLRPAAARTDAQGLAESRVTLGSQPGAYTVGASLAGAPATQPPLAISYTVRDLRWWIVLFVGLVGGLAIFLYGMGQASGGMTSAFGRRMRVLVGSFTHNRALAVGVGAFVTMVIQSSSATTVMLVGFVQARLMTFTQTLGVILGAHIGTTFTTQIIAFRITEYSLLFVAMGFAMMLIPHSDRLRYAGQGVLGFGMVFFGMHVMAQAMAPLAGFEPFIRLIVALENPLVGILLGAALTALIQASGAFIGILIVLASQGLLTLEAAVPLVLGANIGTSITAVLASIPTRRDAKRVALAHVLFQVCGVLVILPWMGPFEDLARWISPVAAVGGTEPLMAAAAIVPRQIANTHTLFNITMTLVFLPFLGYFARLVDWILPDLPEEREAPFKAVYLDESMLTTPAFALSMSRAEVVRMAGLVKRMVETCVLPFVEQRHDALALLDRMEDEVNFLEEKIDDYLTRITQRNVTSPQVEEAFQLMYATTELEQIADIVTKTVRPRAAEWLGFPRRFSHAGEVELRDMHLRAIKQVARASTLLKERSPERARRMREKYAKYRAMEIDFMRSHFQRLREAIPESMATNEFHQELMEQLVRIISHATNIARILLEEDAQPPPPAATPAVPGPDEEARPNPPTQHRAAGDGT
jgi:phosphate:Na+ symporter